MWSKNLCARPFPRVGKPCSLLLGKIAQENPETKCEDATAHFPKAELQTPSHGFKRGILFWWIFNSVAQGNQKIQGSPFGATPKKCTQTAGHQKGQLRSIRFGPEFCTDLRHWLLFRDPAVLNGWSPQDCAARPNGPGFLS